MEAERDTEAEGDSGVTPPPRPKKAVLVRYRLLPRVECFSTRRDDIRPRTVCIAKTERGTELVKVLTPLEPADDRETSGRIVRPATERDLDRMRYIETELAPRELNLCREKAEEGGLNMRLVAAEHLFGGEKIIFYFVAEERVDFRALVRDLAREFRTRIELRQIGVRDEARMLADFEHCGRPLCCKAFLPQFEPVTMRMAKLQKSTLDPGKISGRCGRLMCCLRFEEEVYEELKEALPKKGTLVRAGDAVGKVADLEILSQKVVVKTEDGLTLNVPVAEIEQVPPGTAQEEEPEKKRRKQKPRGDEPQIGGPPAGPQVGGPPLESG